MKNKKKILFVLNCMGFGGVAKSLKNLLIEFKPYANDYDIDLFLLKKTGPHLEGIPDYVNIIEAKGNLQLFGVSQKESKQFGKWFYFKRMLTTFWTRLFTHKVPLKIFGKKARLNKEYDLAVAFTHTQGARNMAAGSVEFVLDHVKAKKKFDVCHGDVVIENLLTKSNVKKFKRFDKVFSVSKSCAQVMAKECPELAPVADYLYNTQNNELIKTMAEENPVDYGKGFHILSIARLEEQKAPMRLLPILKKLHDENFEFTYHFVSNGILEETMKKFLKDNNMEDYVKMHGHQANPYRFLKNADLFSLVSKYEAAPIVYNEAKILNVPIFTTEIISSKEMVSGFGWICENSEEGIYSGLKHILSNPKEVLKVKNETKDFNYNNNEIIEKLLKCADIL